MPGEGPNFPSWLLSQPCYLRDWEMQVHFKIHGQGKKNLNGDGFAIWYTKDRMQPGKTPAAAPGGDAAAFSRPELPSQGPRGYCSSALGGAEGAARSRHPALGALDLESEALGLGWNMWGRP